MPKKFHYMLIIWGKQNNCTVVSKCLVCHGYFKYHKYCNCYISPNYNKILLRGSSKGGQKCGPHYINVHVYSPDICLSLAIRTIITPSIGTLFQCRLLWGEFSAFSTTRANHYNSRVFIPPGIALLLVRQRQSGMRSLPF